MAAPLLDYLSIVDPAHASVVWKYKDQRHVRAQDAYLDQVQRVIRFNLFWRRSITVRHIDLFNNIALMRFMDSRDAALLCENDCLRVTSPNSDPLRDSFHHWALGGTSSQHWHHLTPERQAAVDIDFQAGRLTFEKLAEHLNLNYFQIDLAHLIQNFDINFLGHNRAVLRFAPDPDDYAGDVLRHWNQILSTDRQVLTLDGRYLDQISALFAKGAMEKWRRKQFFTNLESLGSELKAEMRDPAFALAKVGAINQAFYDELERFRFEDEDSLAPVAVSRDIGYLSEFVNPEDTEKSYSRQTGWKIIAFDDIPLKEVARWHAGDTPTTAQFTSSVQRFQDALHQPPGFLKEKEINRLVEQHIEIINSCIEQGIKDKWIRKIDNKETLIQVFMPRHAGVLAVGAAVGIQIAGAAAAANLHGMQNFLASSAFTMVGGATALGLQKKVKTREWKTAECTLKDHITASLTRK